MSLIEAIILGLVQGLTEFIPVSSSGHLVLLNDVIGDETSSLAFDVLLHVGTLSALLIYFRKDIWNLAKNVLNKNTEGRLARLLIYATIPAGVAGLLLSDYVDDNLREPFTVALMLVVVGLLMIVVDKMSKPHKEKEISTKQGIGIGFAQVLALIPGTSRSGITITAGVFAGLTREQATRYSFLLAIPIISASALGIFISDVDTSGLETTNVVVGISAAFVSGYFAIRFMLKWIGKIGLMPFAIYRFVLAAAVLIFLV